MHSLEHALRPEVQRRLDLPAALDLIETLSHQVNHLSEEVSQLEGALKRNYKMFEALLGSGADGIAITGPNREIVRVIKGLTGIDHNSLAGSLIESLAVQEDRQAILDAYDLLLGTVGGQISLHVRLVRDDGTIVSLAAKLTDMLDNPSVQGIVWNYSAIN